MELSANPNTVKMQWNQGGLGVWDMVNKYGFIR